MTRTRPRIELHIDELVLHGFNPADRRGIGDAVERELARLLAGPSGVPMTPTGADRVDAGSFVHDAGAPPRQVGAQIAGAVHGAVQHGPARGTGGPGGSR
jgi:hypothetical protein